MDIPENHPQNRLATDGVFLHVCCAPCLGAAREAMRTASGSMQPVAKLFFFNPNIHPLLEFRRRIKALQLYLERDPVQAEIIDSYGLVEFLRFTKGAEVAKADRRERCRRCYLLRLGKAAEKARKQGYSAISTTLLASRQQDHSLVIDAGRETAKQHGVEFVAADFSSAVGPDKLMRGIYKQQYCGCIFSEEERYRNTNKHLYRPGGDGEPG